MGVNQKHVYRFGYLKSEKWDAVRIQALARDDGKCSICDLQSHSNDGHHIWYPENIWDTTSDHLVILCRGCHEFLHAVCQDCKTNDEFIGRRNWLNFKNAALQWRRTNIILFHPDKLGLICGPKQLREELDRLHKQLYEFYHDDSEKLVSDAKVNKVIRRMESFLEEIKKIS